MNFQQKLVLQYKGYKSDQTTSASEHIFIWLKEIELEISCIAIIRVLLFTPFLLI